MFPDGICRVTDSYYTKTVQFQDINYQLNQNEATGARIAAPEAMTRVRMIVFVPLEMAARLGSRSKPRLAAMDSTTTIKIVRLFLLWGKCQRCGYHASQFAR